MKIGSALIVFAVTISLATTSVRASTMQAGGDRLVATQNGDGGWAFPLIGASAPNTIGTIGMGLAQAYRVTGDSDHLTALGKVGLFLQTRNNDFVVSDGYIAAELDSIFGGTTYTSFVKTNFYDKLAAGTYDRGNLGTLYDTTAFVNHVRASRGGSQANLAAWDIGLGLVGAASVGASTSEWVTGVQGEINELTGGADFDVLGLAGAVFGLARVGANFDPTSGQYGASASSTSDLASILASYQLATGGFTYNSTTLIVNSDETVQETGYAILALNTFDSTAYLSNLKRAGAYLSSAQLVNGGWEDYVGAGENNATTGEALWGFYYAPEPGSMSFLLFGGVTLLRRRKPLKSA